MDLQQKIDYSIRLLQNGEELAKQLSPDTGYYLAFSGGKDSQVLLELAKMADVRYEAYYNPTTLDPAENIRYIKLHYPEVRFTTPKSSIIKLVAKKGLPTRTRRWCCSLFKEAYGGGHVVLTGVRREESRRRAEYAPLSVYSAKKENRRDIELAELSHECINGSDKIMLRPILDWSTLDIWNFIKAKGLPINPCYTSKKRVGCCLCPFASKKERADYLASHPKQAAALLHSITAYLETHPNSRIQDPAEMINWWVDGKSTEEYLAEKKQYKLFPTDGNTDY